MVSWSHVVVGGAVGGDVVVVTDVSVDVAADTIRFATDAKTAMSEKTVKLQLPEEIALIDTVRHGAGTADSWALQLKDTNTSPAHFAYMVRILDDARDVSRAMQAI